MTTTTTLARPVSAPLLILLGSLAAIAPLSTDMYLPAFVLIRQDLGLAAGDVELSFSAYFIGMLIGMLCYGPLSDALGRKRPLLFGLALYASAGFAISLAEGLYGLVFWRFLQGLGGCAGAVLTFAIIRDRCDMQQSAQTISLMILIMGAAPVIAPLLGSLAVNLAGWRTIFSALMLFGIACFAYALVILRDVPVSERDADSLGSTLRQYLDLLKSTRFMVLVLAQAFVMGAMFAYIVGSPLVLLDIHGISPEHFGYFFGANAIGVMIAGQLNRKLLQRHSPQAILKVGLWLPLIGGLLLVADTQLASSSLWLVVPGLFIAVFSVGLVNPNATAMAMSDQARRAGKASAILNSFTFGLGMLAGVLINLLHDGTTAPVAWLILVFGSLALLAGRKI